MILIFLKFLVAWFGSFGEMSEQYLKLDPACFLPHPIQLIIQHHPMIRRYIIRVTGSTSQCTENKKIYPAFPSFFQAQLPFKNFGSCFVLWNPRVQISALKPTIIAGKSRLFSRKYKQWYSATSKYETTDSPQVTALLSSLGGPYPLQLKQFH